jgi:membrane-associated phospholipid phosphatase
LKLRSSHPAAVEAREFASALPGVMNNGNLGATPRVGHSIEAEMLAPAVRRSLLCSGLTLVVFGAIAAGVTSLPAVSHVDEIVDARLNEQAASSPAAVRFFLNVTYLGTSRFLIGLSIGVVVILLLYRQWRLAAAWAITQLISIILIEKTKLAFGRARPAFNGMFTIEDSYSFPSGHALGSMVAFGMLAYLVTLAFHQPPLRRLTVALCALLIALIGFSRLILGVHYLSDVLGGYALGAAWLAFAVALIEDARIHYGASKLQSNGGSGQ